MPRLRPGRSVTLCNPELAPPRTKLWAYGMADLARLFGISPDAVEKLIERGRFDPADLLSVIDYFLHRDVGLGAPYTRRSTRRAA